MSDIIKLNIGGIRYETTLDTLERDNKSMLASMFSGKYKLKTCDDGYHFIDRNGNLFNYIIKFLRDGNINLDGLSYREINDILDEANYYNMDSLINFIENDPYYVKKKLADFNIWYCHSHDTYWKLILTDGFTQGAPIQFERYYTFLSEVPLSTELLCADNLWDGFEKLLVMFNTSDGKYHLYAIDITEEITKAGEKFDEISHNIWEYLETHNESNKSEDELGDEFDTKIKKYFEPPYRHKDDLKDIFDRSYRIYDKISDKYFVKIIELEGYSKVYHVCHQHDEFDVYYSPLKGDEILEISPLYGHGYENCIRRWNYKKDDCDANGKYYRPIVKSESHTGHIYIGYKYIYSWDKTYLISKLLEKEFVKYYCANHGDKYYYEYIFMYLFTDSDDEDEESNDEDEESNDEDEESNDENDPYYLLDNIKDDCDTHHNIISELAKNSDLRFSNPDIGMVIYEYDNFLKKNKQTFEKVLTEV
jgi:hypothetical protein